MSYMFNELNEGFEFFDRDDQSKVSGFVFHQENEICFSLDQDDDIWFSKEEFKMFTEFCQKMVNTGVA